MTIKAIKRRRAGARSEPSDLEYFKRINLKYMGNLLSSPLFKEKPFETLALTASLLDINDIEKCLMPLLPPDKQSEFHERKADHSSGFNAEQRDIDYLMKIIHSSYGTDGFCKHVSLAMRPIIYAKQRQFSKYLGIDRRLHKLSKAFDLSKIDTEIVAFLYCLGCRSEEMGHFLINYDEVEVMSSSLHWLLNCPKNEVLKALDLSGTLFQSQLLTTGSHRHTNTIYTSQWLIYYLSGISGKNLAGQFCIHCTGDSIPLELHHANVESKELMLELLKQKRRGANLLFYGEPGTGKTELAKALAKKLGRKLYIIRHATESDNNQLEAAIYGTTRLISADQSIILVDEADALLNTNSTFYSRSDNRKGWINSFLDKSRHKIIWIVNKSESIDSSIMRRFAFSLKFKKAGVETKIAVFKNRTQNGRLAEYFSDKEIRGICSQYHINAGGIADMLKSLCIAKSDDKAKVLNKIHLLLSSHEEAIGNGNRTKLKPVSNYLIDTLHVSLRPHQLLDSLKTYGDQWNGEAGRRSMNLLFFGQPGTGKTEFAKYIGQALDKEVRLKRASDLISKWVGDSEKLIARAFEEAEADGAVLFIDEADTFFYSRNATQHSWERSQTNEFLTQMENYNGIMICATNLMFGMDEAAMRRFKYKVEFKPLLPAGIVALYNHLFASLVPMGALSGDQRLQLESLTGLSHGDFFVVSEQFALNKCKVEHKDIIEALNNELGFKKRQVRVGFCT